MECGACAYVAGIVGAGGLPVREPGLCARRPGNRNGDHRPPDWMRGSERGRWTLTAEGGAAAKARVIAGKNGAAGRLITGLEYRLAARFDPRRNVTPDLLPASGEASPHTVSRAGVAAASRLRRPEARRVIGAGSAIVTTGGGIGLRSDSERLKETRSRGKLAKHAIVEANPAKSEGRPCWHEITVAAGNGYSVPPETLRSWRSDIGYFHHGDQETIIRLREETEPPLARAEELT